MNKQPLSIYCHLPWCIEKCPYCDFNSFKKTKGDHTERYTQALREDVRLSAPMAKDRPITSIFFGGGTPSLFPAEDIGMVINTIHQHYHVSPNAEITLEMNPSSCEQKKLALWKHHGVNRLSIGAQSFHDQSLKNIGRTHRGHCAHNAIIEAKRCGFNNINIDIMYGLPEQSITEALSDLNQALAHKTEHLSWYELTIEANTAFAKKQPTLPRHDSMSTMDDQGQSIIQKSALERYEISAYAQPGKECVHNMNYWNYGDYLGCGSGASSKLSSDDGILRFQKYRNPSLYQKAPDHRCLEHWVEPQQRIFEYMLNKLRIFNAFELEDVCQATQSEMSLIKQKIDYAIHAGFLKRQGTLIEKTQLGNQYLNDAQALFLPQ